MSIKSIVNCVFLQNGLVRSLKRHVWPRNFSFLISCTKWAGSNQQSTAQLRGTSLCQWTNHQRANQCWNNEQTGMTHFTHSPHPSSCLTECCFCQLYTSPKLSLINNLTFPLRMTNKILAPLSLSFSISYPLFGQRAVFCSCFLFPNFLLPFPSLGYFLFLFLSSVKICI